jgi:hypothetical protein
LVGKDFARKIPGSWYSPGRYLDERGRAFVAATSIPLAAEAATTKSEQTMTAKKKAKKATKKVAKKSHSKKKKASPQVA